MLQHWETCSGLAFSFPSSITKTLNAIANETKIKYFKPNLIKKNYMKKTEIGMSINMWQFLTDTESEKFLVIFNFIFHG